MSYFLFAPFLCCMIFFFGKNIIYKTGIHMWNCLCYKFNWILRKEWKPQQKWFLFRVFFLPFHFMGPTKFHAIINIFAYFCYKCSNAYNVVLYMFMLDIQQQKRRREKRFWMGAKARTFSVICACYCDRSGMIWTGNEFRRRTNNEL